MTEWDLLRRELDAWGETGRQATLWWRDDDAVEPTEALERLLGLAEDSAVPLALAVIPARCVGALPARLDRAADSLRVLQHGFAHRNHAGRGEKKIELGPHRPAAVVAEEISRGLAQIETAFGPRALPVLVPPWNRIDPGLIPELPGLGLRGLSTHGPRPAPRPVMGMWQINSHVDIMRWTDPKGFLGEKAVLTQLRDHLRARRSAMSGKRMEGAAIDPAEPTGLLTHHLVHDEAAWDFLARLLPALAKHPGCDMIDAARAFASAADVPAGARA